MEWLFEPGVRTRRGGSAAAYAFKPTLDVFVREVLQNAKDQKRKDSPIARVHFGLRLLRGESLRSFLATLHWNHVEPHIEAASRSQHAGFLARALATFRLRKELLLLRIDDSGTGGLVGADLERDKPFASLCIDELFSTKESAGTGGSYGLGKSVLWRFSAFSTVLFGSILEQGHYPKGTNGLRMFGRTQLPWHSIDDEDFDGPCWFGKAGKHDGDEIAWSAWDPESRRVAPKLQMMRESTPGTSILLVGFAPPAEETVHPEELCRRFCVAAAKHFWPVLGDDEPQLRVTADLMDIEEDRTLLSAEAGITDQVKPFVACLRAFRSGSTTESLDKDGDVARHDIALKIPATASGGSAIDAKVSLCVRLAPKLKGLVNQAAYTRGFGMVVKYRNLEGISLSAQPFVATLICGTLRGDTSEDQAMETFLRLSEPPEHDTWASNQRLQVNYKKGYATLLDVLERQVAEIIKRLVSQAASEGEAGPQLLSRMFPIGPSGKEKRSHPFSVAKRAAALTPSGDWLFSGEVKRTKTTGPWRVRIALRFSTDDGAEGAVVKSLTKMSPPAKVRIAKGIAIVDLPETADKFAFDGLSDKALHPVESRRSSVRLDVLAGVLDEREAEADGDKNEEEVAN